MIVIVHEPPTINNFHNFLSFQDIKNFVFQSRGTFLLVSGGIILGIAIGGILLFRSKQRYLSWSTNPNSAFPGEIALKTFKRYPGIRNVGNSCYLNCILQALASVHYSFMEIDGQRVSPFTRALLEFLQSLNTSQTRILDASKLIKQMGGQLNHEQQDAHELLQVILSVIGKDLKANCSSDLMSLGNIAKSGFIFPNHEHSQLEGLVFPWEGITASSIHCSACENVRTNRTRTINFSILTLLTESDLETCFATAFMPNHLSDYRCSVCNQFGHCYQLESIIRWPSTLIIHIQRSTVREKMAIKDNRYVRFEARMIGRRQATRLIGDCNRPEYELVAVVEHIGDQGSGHYITYRRVIEESRIRWLYCSDSTVNTVTLDQVLQAHAYLLFYKKVNII